MTQEDFNLIDQEFEDPQKEAGFLSKIIENAPLLIYIHQLDDINQQEFGRVVWSNSQIRKFIGYNIEEIKQLKNELFYRIVHPEDIPLALKTIFILINRKESSPFSGFIRIKTSGGDYKWMNINYSIFKRSSNGTSIQFLNSLYDINIPPIFEEKFDEANKEIRQFKHHNLIKNITKREKEILKLIVKGYTYKEIADILFISQRTAQTHRHNIIKKTKTRNTADLVSFAIKCGLD